ncbi:MAG: SAM-dependent methyltransferase [Chloroflexota bacterium]
MVSGTESQVRAFYDAKNGYLGEQSLYFNQGYWKHHPASHDAASEALAQLLAQVARIGEGDAVLDVGFGFGEQDLLWTAQCRPQRITGLNISPRQTAIARRRVADAGLADRIDLRLGSATRMPLEGEQFDQVVALESAHHFVTRQDFFREAYRVLRPGGRIATTDIVCLEPQPGHLRQLAVYGILWAPNDTLIPGPNRHSRMEYAAQLRRAGFAAVRVVSVREHVYEPLVRHVARRMARGDFSWQEGFFRAAPPATLLEFLNHLGYAMTYRALAAWLQWSPETAIRAVRAAPIDYVVATGIKPLEAALLGREPRGPELLKREAPV